MKNIKGIKRKGFTLIELMIVVAIIGILSAVAYPSYQSYTRRAHVSEGLGLAQGAKVAVSEFYATQGQWPTTNAQAGVGTISGNAVLSVEIGANGVIVIAYDTEVDDATANQLKLTPTDSNGSIQWECTAGDAGDQKSVKAIYLPSSCR